MSDRELRTVYSMQAMDLATMYKTGPGQLRLGTVGYVPELTAPEGVSTGGGKQALQHVRLVPSSKGFAILTAGDVNPVTRTTELRSYEYVDQVHRQRFGKPVPLDRNSFNTFLDATRHFLEACGLRVVLSTPPRNLGRGAEGTPARAPWKIAVVAIVAALVVAGIAVAVMWYGLGWRSR